MTMIVEDTIAIGRRLRELQEASKGPGEFKLPDDVLILRTNDVHSPRFAQAYEIVFALHETRPPKLAIVHFRDPETAKQRLIEFLHMFEQHYPSANAHHGEITISPTDYANLIEWLRRHPPLGR